MGCKKKNVAKNITYILELFYRCDFSLDASPIVLEQDRKETVFISEHTHTLLQSFNPKETDHFGLYVVSKNNIFFFPKFFTKMWCSFGSIP